MATLRIALGLVAAGCVVASCGGANAFACRQDVQCSEGVCTEQGFCAFNDPACDSGIRFSEHAGDGWAGLCVPAATATDDAATTTGGGTGEDDSPPDTSTSDTLGADATAAPDGSTTVPVGDTDSTDGGSTTTGLVDCQTWWDVDWPWRRSIGVRGLKGATLGADFVLPVRIGTELDPAELLDDASDLVFIGEGCTPLPHQIELSSDGVPTVAWVSLPQELSLEGVYAYYGGPRRGSNNGGAVWGADTIGVWHLPRPFDAAHASHLTEPVLPAAEGILGQASEFPGGPVGFLQAPPTPTLAIWELETYSISAWIRIDAGAMASTMRIVDKSLAVNSAEGYAMSVRITAGGAADLIFDRGLDVAELSRITVNAPLSLGQWHHVAAVYDAVSPVVMYVDGIAQADQQLNAAPEGLPASDEDVPLTIGDAPYASRAFIGRMDELRIFAEAKSPDWIAAEYAAGVGVLIDLGPPESAP